MTMLDDAPSDTEDPEVAPDDSDGEPPRPRRRPRPESPSESWWSNLPMLLVLALAFLVIAGAVLLWKENRELADARDDRREVAGVAGEFVTAVLSYDHRNLQGSVDDVLALSTPDWGREYEDEWFSEQQPVVEELQAVAEVDVRDVMVGDEQDGVVPAVVVFNASIDSAIGTRRLGGSYLRLDLVESGGEWRVDNMIFLANTDQSLDPAVGDPAPGGPAAEPTP